MIHDIYTHIDGLKKYLTSVQSKESAIRYMAVMCDPGVRVWAVPSPRLGKATLPDIGPLPSGDSPSHRDFTKRKVT
jgi:hypothetical protein